jgi:hypothetical protein
MGCTNAVYFRKERSSTNKTKDHIGSLVNIYRLDNPTTDAAAINIIRQCIYSPCRENRGDFADFRKNRRKIVINRVWQKNRRLNKI